MKKEEKSLGCFLHEERGHDRLVTDGDIHRLRSAQKLIDDVASQIPPFTSRQIHAVVESNRLSQFQLRRQADRYLLTICLLILALAASLLWHTAPAGLSPLNLAVLILAVADAWVALRAARSLWLMWQTHRLRRRPYRMARYADRLSRLSRRRRWWLGFVLRSGYNPVSDKDFRRLEFFPLRLPSYTIAACLFLLIALNADKTFAATRDYVNVTTTTEKTATAICDTVGEIIQQL